MENDRTTVADLPTKRLAIRMTILASLGLLMNGYDLTMFSVALLFFPHSLLTKNPGLGILGAAVLGGMLVGSWAGGASADRRGRRQFFRWDLAVVAVCSIIAIDIRNPWVLIGVRFILGVGNGIDYPISASVAAEFSSDQDRSRRLITTIGAWAVGALLAYLVSLVCVALVPSSEVWRYLFGSDSIVAIVIIILRYNTIESPRWAHRQSVTGNRRHDSSNRPRLFVRPLLFVIAFTAGSWFLYDIADYGAVIFTPYMLEHVSDPTSFTTILLTGLATVLASICGIAATWLMIRRLGIKHIQGIGYGMMTAIFLVLAWVRVSFGAFACLLGGLYFFMEGGPGQTTYVYSGQTFPTEVRASGHGFASAFSRAGAIVGVLGFPWVTRRFGFHASLFAFGLISAGGMMITLLWAPRLVLEDPE